MKGDKQHGRLRLRRGKKEQKRRGKNRQVTLQRLSVTPYQGLLLVWCFDLVGLYVIPSTDWHGETEMMVDPSLLQAVSPSQLRGFLGEGTYKFAPPDVTEFHF